MKVTKDGMIILAYGKYNEDNNRYISHLLKDGDEEGLRYAAERMASLIPKNGRFVLVPIPGHTGKAIQTLELAKSISRLRGIPVMDVLEGKDREPLYSVKKQGHILSENEIGFRMKSPSLTFQSGIPILVDNCCDYGYTAKCAMNAIGKPCYLLAYSMTDNINNSRVIESLNNHYSLGARR